MIYADTSVIVSLLTMEASTAAVTAWFTGLSGAPVSADWCVVEFASALSMKQRAGQLTLAHARAAHAAFDTLAAGGLKLIPVSRAAFRQAADLVKPHRDGLRAGDALHLAVAREAGAKTLACLDKAMSANARRLGFELVAL